MKVKTAQSSLTPFGPMDYILQARILEWVAFPFSRGSSQPKDQTQVSYVSCTGRGILYHCAIWEAQKEYMKVKVKLALTLCDPMNYTVHGIFQARILEWVAIPFSRGSSQPRDRTQVSHIAGGFFTS